ncbi:MAG: hypothetical protein GY849_01145 [Deltaproteobacteria bacterium]|nr:hypothetical protein [Deltaproteobacteria bacterium]
MRRKQWLFLIVLGVILFSQLSCGRKAPPFVPEERVHLRVTQLKGEWKKGDVVLKGRVAVPQGGEKEISQITGCRVYHARYSAGNPPCETCPLTYKAYTEIKGEVIKEGRFLCRLRKEKNKGLHFFEVRLIGKRGEPGPSSNRVKLTIDN